MGFRISRVSVFWLVLAAAMFVASVVITLTVTWTEGGLLERGQNDPGGHAVQIISIYEPGATAQGVSRYYVNYGETADGEKGLITFLIPPSATPVLLLTNLVDDRGCSSPRSADSWAEHEAYGGGVNVDTARFDSSDAGAELYLVRPVPSDFSTQVICRVRPVSRPETFTSRILPVKHYSPKDDPAYQEIPRILAGLDTDIADALAGLDPLPSILVNFSNIAGARDMRFVGGYEPEGEYAHESKRRLVAGQYAWVMWDDLYRQQMRDILLIVIGTLIGIGVTVMIEGLRPMIEHFGRDRPRAEKPAQGPADDSP